MLCKSEIAQELRSTAKSCQTLTELQKRLNDDDYLSIGDLRILERRLDGVLCYGNHYLISIKIDIRKQIKNRLRDLNSL